MDRSREGNPAFAQPSTELSRLLQVEGERALSRRIQQAARYSTELHRDVVVTVSR